MTERSLHPEPDHDAPDMQHVLDRMRRIHRRTIAHQRLVDDVFGQMFGGLGTPPRAVPGSPGGGRADGISPPAVPQGGTHAPPPGHLRLIEGGTE